VPIYHFSLSIGSSAGQQLLNRAIGDVDEGKQFYVSSIDIVGADAQVLNDLAVIPGHVYDVRLVELFLRKHLPEADVNDPNIQHRLSNPWVLSRWR
jgi:hypothetical protein